MPSDEIPTTARRVAVVTGGNHGIGAATAIALAAAGVDVLVTYLRLADPTDASRPPEYAAARSRATPTRCWRRSTRCRAAVRRSRSTSATTTRRRGSSTRPSEQLGPVSILVNNASGWVADTFDPTATDAAARVRADASPATSASMPAPARC